MRTPILAVFMTALATMSCAPGPAEVAWRGHTLREVRSLAALPEDIRSELGAGRPRIDGIADRGRPFNKTDVVVDRLPMRRFLTAGIQGDICLVALERGGRSYSVEVLLFSRPDTPPEQRWVLPGRPKTLREVIQKMPKDNGGERDRP